MILAKPVVENQYWILKKDDRKIGQVEAVKDGFDVKILDPDTKQPTSFLSNKGHCVYLEVINY